MGRDAETIGQGHPIPDILMDDEPDELSPEPTPAVRNAGKANIQSTPEPDNNGHFVPFQDEPDEPEQPPAKQSTTQQDQDRVLQLAIEMGYKPDYQGENRKSPEEFIRYERKRADDNYRRNKELESRINEMEKRVREVVDTTSSAKVQELMTKFHEAVEEGRVEESDKIMEEIFEARTSARQSPPQKQQDEPQSPSPEFLAWKQQNSWYDNDPELRTRADAYGEALMKTGKMAPSEILREVSKVFGQSQADSGYRRAPDVATGRNRTAPRQRLTMNDVGDDVRQTAINFVNMGIYKNTQAYIDDLVKTGVLG